MLTGSLKMLKSKMTSKEEKIDKLTFQLPLSLKAEFKAKLAKENKTVRLVLENYISSYVKNNGE